MNEVLKYKVEENESQRLDNFILSKLNQNPTYSALTRSQIQSWIADGLVRVQSKVVTKSGAKVKKGDEVVLEPKVISTQDLVPWNAPLEIKYEDEELLVIDKPAGLSVHPGAGNFDKTLVNILVHRYGTSLPPSAECRPGIVHRLDKDTTGLLVVAKTPRALSGLSIQFSTRTVTRRYQALIRTMPKLNSEIAVRDEGRIVTLIGRHPTRRVEMAVVEEGGQKAVTNWKVVERYHYASLVDLKLETGRTHQIRVHMTYLKAPIIGDPVYGDFNMLPAPLYLAAQNFGRQALHAQTLGFIHPVSGKELNLSSSVPADMASLIDKFKNFVR